MSQIAVLTGDIVNSSALSPEELDKAMDCLKNAMSAITQWTPQVTSPLAQMARQGGDGWQAVLTHPRSALRASLFLRASLMAAGPFQTRIAVAEGTGSDGLVAMRNPNYGHGTAYTQSGRLLERMPRNAYLMHASGGALSATFLLADHISLEWTQSQAKTIALALTPDGHTQQTIANQQQVSRQAVAQSLKSAGYTAISAALDLIEADTSERHQDA